MSSSWFAFHSSVVVRGVLAMCFMLRFVTLQTENFLKIEKVFVCVVWKIFGWCSNWVASSFCVMLAGKRNWCEWTWKTLSQYRWRCSKSFCFTKVLYFLYFYLGTLMISVRPTKTFYNSFSFTKKNLLTPFLRSFWCNLRQYLLPPDVKGLYAVDPFSSGWSITSGNIADL